MNKLAKIFSFSFIEMQICVFGYHKIIYISGYVQGEKWDMYNFNLKFEQS